MEFLKCNTKTNVCKKLIDFLDSNQDLVLIPTDKNKGVAILTHSEYLVKLDQTFNSEKFKKLNSSPLRKNIREFQKDLQNFAIFWNCNKKIETNAARP